MKVKLNLDTDDYLILFLLFFGSVLAIYGIYAVFVEVVDWLSSALTNVRLN